MFLFVFLNKLCLNKDYVYKYGLYRQYINQPNLQSQSVCYWQELKAILADMELYLLVQPTTHTKKFPLVTVHITHEAWHMTTKSLHNIYFHNHWPTTTLGMQHTVTTQYTSYIIQTSIITGLQQH